MSLLLLFDGETVTPVAMRARGVSGSRFRKRNVLDGCLEYWDLDEESGTAIGAVNARNMTAENAPLAADGPGGQGRARDLVNANAQAFSQARASWMNIAPGPFTIVGWHRFAGPPPTFPRTFDLGFDGTSGLALVSSTTNGVTLYLNGASQASPAGPGSAAWAFYDGRYDDALDQIVVGVQLSRNTQGGITSWGDGTEELTFGREAAFAGTEYYEGRLARQGFWNRYLTDGQLTGLYNGGIGKYARILDSLATGVSAARSVGGSYGRAVLTPVDEGGATPAPMFARGVSGSRAGAVATTPAALAARAVSGSKASCTATPKAPIAARGVSGSTSRAAPLGRGIVSARAVSGSTARASVSTPTTLRARAVSGSAARALLHAESSAAPPIDHERWLIRVVLNAPEWTIETDLGAPRWYVRVPTNDPEWSLPL